MSATGAWGAGAAGWRAGAGAATGAGPVPAGGVSAAGGAAAGTGSALAVSTGCDDGPPMTAKTPRAATAHTAAMLAAMVMRIGTRAMVARAAGTREVSRRSRGCASSAGCARAAPYASVRWGAMWRAVWLRPSRASSSETCSMVSKPNSRSLERSRMA